MTAFPVVLRLVLIHPAVGFPDRLIQIQISFEHIPGRDAVTAPGQVLSDLFNHAGNCLLPVMEKEHRKLVSADPVCQCVPVRHRAQALTNPEQRFIPGRMPVIVIQFLQPVHVQGGCSQNSFFIDGTVIIERLSVQQTGQRIPPVRELAVEAGVNPNTMQRALGELERLGLVYSQRTSGRFVTEDTAMIETAKQELASRRITEFLRAMEDLGFAPAEIPALIQTAQKEEKHNDPNS